jgi:hypothetical protein
VALGHSAIEGHVYGTDGDRSLCVPCLTENAFIAGSSIGLVTCKNLLKLNSLSFALGFESIGPLYEQDMNGGRYTTTLHCVQNSRRMIGLISEKLLQASV